MNWRKYLDLSNPIGSRLSRACIDVITRLCCDEKDRLGWKLLARFIEYVVDLGRNGAKEIKAHPWFKVHCRECFLNNVCSNLFKGIDFDNLRKAPAEFVPKVEHAEDTSNFDTFEVNAEELFRENYSGPNSSYNPAFFDFTFRHFFTNDGAHKMNHARSQQRPSLAPLLEAQSSGCSTSTDKKPAKPAHSSQYRSNNSTAPNEVKKTIQPSKSVRNTESSESYRSTLPTTHSIFNRQLQKHNVGRTNESLPGASHSTYSNGSGLPHVVRTYDKYTDSNV